MLVERQRRRRIHRSSELTGAGTQQGVMQQIVRTLQPHSEPKPESGLGGSRSHARAEPGPTTHVGNPVADPDKQRERRAATSTVAVQRIQDQQHENHEGQALECELEPDPEQEENSTPPYRRPARPPQHKREPAEQESLEVDRVSQKRVRLFAVVQTQTRGRDVLDDLEHTNKRASDGANEQPCQKPSTILRAE